MRQQLERLAIAVGEFFEIGMKKILPIINGFIMAAVVVVEMITEFIKQLTGYEEEKLDYDNIKGLDDSIGDIIDGMEEADEKAKELAKDLLGIDELNILQEKQEPLDMEIDKTILDTFKAALEDWDNKMESVRMKAYGIRDAILEWLGIVQSGDGSWGLAEGESRIKNIMLYIGKILDKLEQIKDGGNFFGGIKAKGLLDNLKEIWNFLGGIILLFVMLKHPALSALALISTALLDIKQNGADFDNITKLVEGLGLALLSIGLILNNPPFIALGFTIFAITKLIRDLKKAFDDGNVTLKELAKILLDIGLVILAKHMVDSLNLTTASIKKLFGWTMVTFANAKGWGAMTILIIKDIGKAIVAALGGSSAARSALMFLWQDLQGLLIILGKIAGAVLIVKSGFEIWQDIVDLINGVITPLEFLYKTLTDVALGIAAIMLLLGNYKGVAIAMATWGTLKIGESVLGISDKDIDARRAKLQRQEEYDKKQQGSNGNFLGDYDAEFDRLMQKYNSNFDLKDLNVNIELDNTIQSIDGTIGKVTTESSSKRTINNTYRMPKYANGGYPNRGMFLMNEGSSAEMVGTLGGKTAVVNNEEIASALASAMTPLLGTVVEAVQNVAANDRPVVVEMDSRVVARGTATGRKKLGFNQIGGEFANV